MEHGLLHATHSSCWCCCCGSTLLLVEALLLLCPNKTWELSKKTGRAYFTAAIGAKSKKPTHENL